MAGPAPAIGVFGPGERIQNAPAARFIGLPAAPEVRTISVQTFAGVFATHVGRRKPYRIVANEGRHHARNHGRAAGR